MDREVPEFGDLVAAGRGDDDDCGGYYFTELLELLRNGDDGGGGSSAAAHVPAVKENPSPNLPPPTTTTKSTTASSVDQLMPSAAGEAEMASWLSQVFNYSHEPSSAAAAVTAAGTSTSRDDSGLPAATADAATNAVRCRSGRRRGGGGGGGGGGRRSCSGRAAEQRRRDRINDKMRTLQQLVPTCSKERIFQHAREYMSDEHNEGTNQIAILAAANNTQLTDKASTLEEVIQYVKSLQQQLQVMSTGYGGANVPTVPLPPPSPSPPPPPCMQQPPAAGHGSDVFSVMMFPPYYPFIGPPVVFACPHRSNNGSVRSPPLLPRQLVHHSRVVPSVDHLAVPISHEKADDATAHPSFLAKTVGKSESS